MFLCERERERERERESEGVVVALRRICVREGLSFFADAAFHFILIFLFEISSFFFIFPPLPILVEVYWTIE